MDEHDFKSFKSNPCVGACRKCINEGLQTEDGLDVNILGDLPTRARELVLAYVKDNFDDSFTLDQVYVVWSTKVLDHWKAMVSTTLPDGIYYEVTHNGIAKETYLDVYFKEQNILIKDGSAVQE